MKIREELITPEIAKMLLSSTKTNRDVRLNWVHELSRMMQLGLWREHTGEAIKIDKNGNLLDGQHRLLALIESNLSFKFVIASDLPPDIFSVIDSGIKRGAKDVLKVNGAPNSKDSASIIRRYRVLMVGQKHIAHTANTNVKGISNAEINSTYDNARQYWDAITAAATHWYKISGKILSVSEFGAYYAYLASKFGNDEKASEFMSIVANGSNLNEDDPIHLLRKKIIANLANKQQSLNSAYKTGLIMKTFELWITNKRVSKLIVKQ